MTDQELLEQSINRLKLTGAIEYTGEFGAEITTFIPFAFWLKQEGLLAGRRLVTYGGMRPYYYFLGDDEYQEKTVARVWVAPSHRDWPTNSTYSATSRPWHVYPDYRSIYRGQGRLFSRPVLFVQNKFTLEFGKGPINYLSIRALKQLLERAADRFDVVYSRPRTLPKSAGYTTDENTHCDYPELDLVRSFGNVLVLEDYCADEALAYNSTKLEILAKSHLFVAVQGGGAHLLACFGRSVLLLLHYEGREYPHAYTSGPYKYLSTSPPVLLLAREHDQLLQGVDVMCNLRAEGEAMMLEPQYMPAFEAMRV